MNKATLKPCPFCGGVAEVRDFRVRCGDCGAFSSWGAHVAEGIAAWNARAEDTTLSAYREALEPFVSLAKAVTDESDPGYRAWVSESADWMVVFSFAGQSINLGQLRALAALNTPKSKEAGQ